MGGTRRLLLLLVLCVVGLGDCGARTGLYAPVDAGKNCSPTPAAANTCEAGQTTLSGVAFDPAGLRPLPNAAVYVPSGALDPIASGPVCTSCAAALSGSPIAVTLTDALGRFTLTNVPAGPDVPVVVQLGKWRRQITVPVVSACTANLIADGALRLPRNSQEGNIPLMAMSTGCDQVECFLLNTVGLDPAEFTGPAGGGRVHVFRGDDVGQGLPSAPGDAYALWGDLATMKQYDILFNACECSTVQRDTDGPAYANMQQYLDTGGRLFATHYHYNWFASTTQCANGSQCNVTDGGASDPSCEGPPPWNGTADWLTPRCAPGDFLINVGIPRGHTMADWYFKVTNEAVPWGELPLIDTRNDVGETHDSGTPWITINGGPLAGVDTYYLSFNTPVGVPVASQCGRAVFSDVHLVGNLSNADGPWPASCTGTSTDDHTPNELALEYLFFDLESCVQDDTKPPTLPCSN